MVTTLLAGCGTVVRSLPLPEASGRSDHTAVRVYFGTQAHPAVKSDFGKHSASARVAREANGEQPTCEKALGEALGKLREFAKNRGANAIINVTTRFHSTRSDSSTTYTCGVSPSAGAISVAGDVVLLDVQ